VFTGKEVAKFSKIHYPQLLLEQLVANEGDVAMALRESFHRIDEELEDPVSAHAWSSYSTEQRNMNIPVLILLHHSFARKCARDPMLCWRLSKSACWP
jgi:hypothetical protein